MSIDPAKLPTDDDVRYFQENGFWLGPKVLTDSEIETLRDHMDRLWNQEYETGKGPWSTSWKPGDSPSALRKMDQAHWSDSAFRAVATHPTIGAIASRLTGKSPIRLWHDQLLYKPGGGKPTGNVGWHQDYNYWQCAASPDLVTGWVALDDVNIENGCMMFVPRSNHWGLLNENDFFNTDIEGSASRMKIPEGETFTKIPCIIPAGAVSFHHAMTLHGSGPNLTDRPRRSFVVHMMAGPVRYKANSASEGHMNVKLLSGKDGDIFEGEHFPILYDSASTA